MHWTLKCSNYFDFIPFVLHPIRCVLFVFYVCAFASKNYLFIKKIILLKLIRNLRFEFCDLCDLHGENDDDEIYRWIDSRLQEKKRVFCWKNCLFFILRFPSVFEFCVFCISHSSESQWENVCIAVVQFSIFFQHHMVANGE